MQCRGSYKMVACQDKLLFKKFKLINNIKAMYSIFDYIFYLKVKRIDFSLVCRNTYTV